MWFFFVFPASVNQWVVNDVIANGGSLNLILQPFSSDCWATDNVDIFERYPGVFPLRHDSRFEDNLDTSFCGQIVAQSAGNILWINGEPRVYHVGKEATDLADAGCS